MDLDDMMRQMTSVLRMAALIACIRSVAALRHLGAAHVAEREFEEYKSHCNDC